MTKTSELAKPPRQDMETRAARVKVEAGSRTKRRGYKDTKSFRDSVELQQDLMRRSCENKAADGKPLRTALLGSFKATLKSL